MNDYIQCSCGIRIWTLSTVGLLTILNLNLYQPSLEMDREKLIEIVDMVNSCIGKEFEKDEHAFRILNGREPTDSERPGIHLSIREL